MWKSIVTCLLVVGAVSAFKKVYHINKETDDAIPHVNQQLTERGLGIFHFHGMPDERVQFGPGVQLGLNTLYRRGNATLVSFRNGSSYYDFKFGFRLFAFGFGRLTWESASMAGLFRVRDSGIHVSYWVHNGTVPCRMELERFTLTELDDATLYSSDPDYDGLDVSDLTRDYIREKANLIMEGQREAVRKRIEQDICLEITFRGFAALGHLYKP